MKSSVITHGIGQSIVGDNARRRNELQAGLRKGERLRTDRFCSIIRPGEINQYWTDHPINWNHFEDRESPIQWLQHLATHLLTGVVYIK